MRPFSQTAHFTDVVCIVCNLCYWSFLLLLMFFLYCMLRCLSLWVLMNEYTISEVVDTWGSLHHFTFSSALYSTDIGFSACMLFDGFVERYLVYSSIEVSEIKPLIDWLIDRLIDWLTEIMLNGFSIKTSSVVTCLGVKIDAELTFSTHVKQVAARCFYQLRQLWSIRPALTSDSAIMLIHALIASRVDYW